MLITTGNIDSLINWFEHGSYSELKFLCLLVAGHLNDVQFFTDVFDKKEVLDAISGDEIAIFLFADEQGGLLEIETGEGQREILPGSKLYLPKSPFDNDRYFRGMYKHISEIRVSDLHQYHLREEVIARSQSVSNEICRKFRLDTEDIPCILLLPKGNPEPFVIKTRGQADVEEFCKFIIDIRRLAATLPLDYDLHWSLQTAEKFALAEREASVKLWVTEAETELERAIEYLRDLLEQYGMPHTVCQQLFSPQTAADVWQTLGLNPGRAQPRLAAEFSEVIQRAISESDLKKRAREVVRCAKALAKANGERNQAIGRLKKSLPKIQTVQTSIDNLCERYENKFVWKARYRPIKQFVETVLGISKKASDLLSLQESIKKLIP